MKTFVVAVLSLALTSLAYGQDCSSISNSADRLSCYDTKSGRTTIKPLTFGKWSVFEANGASGSSAPIASIETASKVQCGNTQGPVAMTIDCTGEMPVLFLSFECRVGGDHDSLLVEFHYPSYSNSFFAAPSKDGKSLGTWNNDIQQIRGMSDGELQVTVTGQAVTLTPAEFRLEGTESLQKYLVERQCIWMPKAG